MYNPMAKTKIFRIESAHQPVNGEFYRMTRYSDTYYDARNCLEEEDCLNGEIYLNDCLLEEKDRDGIWSLGPDAKYIVACDYEPYWDKDTESYVTGIHACDMDEYVRTKRREYPDKSWTYISWPEKDIMTLPKGGKMTQKTDEETKDRQAETNTCTLIVKIEMVLEGDSTPIQAEDSVCDWIDRMMLYQIGYNEVADKKRPRVFDYDIHRTEVPVNRCEQCPECVVLFDDEGYHGCKPDTHSAVCRDCEHSKDV